MSFWMRKLAWTLAILLGISTILSYRFKKYVSGSGGQEIVITRAKIRTIELMLTSQKLFNHRYPTQEEGLEKMMGMSSITSSDSRISERIKDGWKRKLRYRIPGIHHPESYDLYSLGEDGLDDTEDDIGNWESPSAEEADSPAPEAINKDL